MQPYAMPMPGYPMYAPPGTYFAPGMPPGYPYMHAAAPDAMAMAMQQQAVYPQGYAMQGVPQMPMAMGPASPGMGMRPPMMAYAYDPHFAMQAHPGAQYNPAAQMGGPQQQHMGGPGHGHDRGSARGSHTGSTPGGQ